MRNVFLRRLSTLDVTQLPVKISLSNKSRVKRDVGTDQFFLNKILRYKQQYRKNAVCLTPHENSKNIYESPFKMSIFKSSRASLQFIVEISRNECNKYKTESIKRFESRALKGRFKEAKKKKREAIKSDIDEAFVSR